jgi:hypothetical protein
MFAAFLSLFASPAYQALDRILQCLTSVFGAATVLPDDSCTASTVQQTCSADLQDPVNRTCGNLADAQSV